MPRYIFVQWVDEAGNTIGATPSINLLIDRDKILTAYYQEAPVVTYTLTIASTAGGTTSPAPGSYTYATGASVSVTALPNAGYSFDHWTLDGATRTENPITVTMDKNYALTAYFKALPPVQYTLTINTTAGGTTNPVPGNYTYNEGTTIQVTATPSTGYNFNHWTLDGVTYTTNPISVLMNQNHALTAYFSEIPPPPPETYKLNLNTTVGGTTDPAPGIIEVTSGNIITVTAVPVEGYQFKQWELDGVAVVQNPINILMDKDHTLLAVFTTPPPPSPIPGWIILPMIIGGVIVGYLLTRKR